MNAPTPMILPISIVIPTYFEEKRIGILLESIKKQSAQPLEIIVSDFYSTDKTREIAESFEARIVDGGSCAVGKNNGARVAKGELLLFMDADSEMLSEWVILDAYTQFMKAKSDIASIFFKQEQSEKRSLNRIIPSIIYAGTNLTKSFQKMIGKVIFAEMGGVTLIKKEVYFALGGYNIELPVSEDRALFSLASKKGYRYTVLNLNIAISARRYSTVRRALLVNVGLFGAFVLGLTGIKALMPLRKKFWKLYGSWGGKQES